MTDLIELLADCDAQGIRLLPGSDGGLTIDAPQEALTPDLISRLKAHKAELLASLQGNTPEAERPDATALWHAALDRLAGDPLFPPDVMAGLRTADVHWASDGAPAAPAAKAVCRCGSTGWRDMPIHAGQSIRRDCARCGRFIDFPLWYGKDTLRTGQQRVQCWHGQETN